MLASLGVTPYVDRALELLKAAERDDPETKALLVERDGTVAALALFGPVAGAQDTWKIDAFLMSERLEGSEVGRALLDAVVAAATKAGGRLLTAELPADPVIGRTLSLLRANGFKQDGKIPDYFRDGVALLFLRRAL